MPARSEVAIGDRFGRWTVVGDRYWDGKNSRAPCRCDCGAERAVLIYMLRGGRTTGCGCGARTRRLIVRPGDTYGSWTVVEEQPREKRSRQILCRCTCGRERTVPLRNLTGGLSTRCKGCASREVGERPSPEHSIGRIDNGGDYAPGNVRWQTREEKARNTCRNWVWVRGEPVTMRDIGERHGISRQAVEHRLRRGWTPEECWDYGKGQRPSRLCPAPKKDSGVRSYSCGLCGDDGHNRRTCPERNTEAA